MFAVGHLAIGYLLGKASSRLLGMDVNIPFLFLFAILPDIDIVLRRFGVEHRGPTHSLIVLGIISLPMFLVLREKALPYVIALGQHSLVGDLLIGEVQLFWPLSSDFYGVSSIGLRSVTNILLEWGAFLGAMLLLFASGDVWVFIEPHRSNWALLVPLVPLSLSLLALVFYTSPLYYAMRVPNALLIPHVVFFFLFSSAVFVDLIFGVRTIVQGIRLHLSAVI